MNMRFINFFAIVSVSFLSLTSLALAPITASAQTGYGSTSCYGKNAGAFPAGSESSSTTIPSVASGQVIQENDPLGAIESFEFTFLEGDTDGGTISYQIVCPQDVASNCANCLLSIRFNYQGIDRSKVRIKIRVKLYDSVTGDYTRIEGQYFNPSRNSVNLNKIGTSGGISTYETTISGADVFSVCGISIGSTIRTGAESLTKNPIAFVSMSTLSLLGLGSVFFLTRRLRPAVER